MVPTTKLEGFLPSARPSDPVLSSTQWLTGCPFVTGEDRYAPPNAIQEGKQSLPEQPGKYKNTNRKKFILFNVLQKSISRTKCKLNIIRFVYATIQFFILTLLFKQKKAGSNLGIVKEENSNFLLCLFYTVCSCAHKSGFFHFSTVQEFSCV